MNRQFNIGVPFGTFSLNGHIISFHKCRASDISRKKKKHFAGFSGANSRKNRPISWEKSQKSRKNRPISRGKSQNLPENRSILQEFSGKKSNFEGFYGANS